MHVGKHPGPSRYANYYILVLPPPRNPNSHVCTHTQESLVLLHALIQAFEPRPLLRPFVRRFAQQLFYLLLAEEDQPRPPSSSSKSSAARASTGASSSLAPAAAGAAAAEGKGTKADKPQQSSGGGREFSSAGTGLLQGESLTVALAIIGELALVGPEDLRPYVHVLMPR